MSTKTFQNFFLSHKPKHLPKLALPIKNNNNQKIAYWYKPTYNENKKKKHKKFWPAASIGISGKQT
jgi:hypothetical protein